MEEKFNDVVAESIHKIIHGELDTDFLEQLLNLSFYLDGQQEYNEAFPFFEHFKTKKDLRKIRSLIRKQLPKLVEDPNLTLLQTIRLVIAYEYLNYSKEKDRANVLCAKFPQKGFKVSFCTEYWEMLAIIEYSFYFDKVIFKACSTMNALDNLH